tara:strand:+ start:889 stop:2970 length:2082 start_codon:yes stop_codon:yes gene_type:complete
MKFKNVFSVVFLFISAKILPQNISSDSLGLNLKEVIISATRTPRELSSLPLPVTLVDQEIISSSGVVRLDEILIEQTGVNIVADESGFEGIQMQGISSDYILILIDGVPLIGRKAGNFDLSRMAIGNIKQIEIVKGPSSSLFGSEALGGVINIITEEPKTKKLNGNFSYRFGSFNQQDINTNIKQNSGKFKFNFFFNRLSSDGYQVDSESDPRTFYPFKNYTLHGKISNDFSKKLTGLFSFRFYDNEQLSMLILNEEDFEGETQENDMNIHLKFDQNVSKKFNIDYELYFTSYNADELIQSLLTENILNDNFFNQKLLRPEIRGNLKLKSKSNFSGGIGYQYEELSRTFFDDNINFSSQYFFIQGDFYLADKLNLIAGSRFDNHSEYKSQLSPKLAFYYKANKSLALKASVGFGFKSPAFRQLYFNFTNSSVGYTVLGYNVALDKLDELIYQNQIQDVVIPRNELINSLDAESSIGYNLGISIDEPKWKLDLNFFRNDIKNLIDTRIIARKNNGQNVFSYVNFDQIFTTGLELNFNHRITEKFNINGGYQLLYAFDKVKIQQINSGEIYARETTSNKTVELSNKDYFGLVNRSRHLGNLKFFYSFTKSKLKVNLRFIYRSKYAEFDTNGNGLVDSYDTSFINGYLTTNISAIKDLSKKIDFQLGLSNNLIDYTDANTPKIPGALGFLKLTYKT